MDLSIATVEVLGVPLAKIDYKRTIDAVDLMVATKQKGYICVAAVHTVMSCQDDSALRAAVMNATFTVPDGQPLVWAINALGSKLSSRVYGPELMARYCQHAAHTGKRIYLYGGRSEEALAELERKLLERYTNLQIVGSYSPPFRELTETELAKLTKQINLTEPDVIWVGIGVPKQEKWMAKMRQGLNAPALIGVGAAFDFHAGLIPQAPNWMQSIGLEWAFRLAQEPKRLWRRYALYNPRFVWSFARQFVQSRQQNTTPGADFN